MLKKRFLLAVGIVLLAMFSSTSIAFGGEQFHIRENIAEEETIIFEPFLQHTAIVNANLNINNGRATMTGSIIGNVGTTHIIATVTLDRVNPNGTETRIATFSNIRANGDIWVWSGQRYVARGHFYRVTVTSTVFRNGESETVSASSRLVWAN